MIKPDLQFTLICDDVRIENNGKFMLIGLFDNIAARTIPVVHKQLVVVNRWGKGEGEFTEHVRIIQAEASVATTFPSTSTVMRGTGNSRSVLKPRRTYCHIWTGPCLTAWKS